MSTRNIEHDALRAKVVRIPLELASVFDKDYKFKYALEGTDTSLQRRRGTLYPWKRNQITDADFYTAKVQVTPSDADDVVFLPLCLPRTRRRLLRTRLQPVYT